MFHTRFAKFITLATCSILFITICCRAVTADELINELTSNDRKELEVFFRYLITLSDFGYTLFGEKPISMDAWSTKLSLSYLFYPVVNNQVILKKGWYTWLKYSHLFQGKRFCLRATPHFHGFSTAIYLINRESTSRKIKNHLDTFKRYLGKDVTPNDILKRLEKDHSVLDQTLSGNEELLGILLGYGAINAKKFQKFKKLNEITNKIPPFPRRLYVTVADDPLEREIQRLQWKDSKSHVRQASKVEMDPELAAIQLKSINWEEPKQNNDPLAQIYLPAFRCIANEQESEELIQAYRMTRAKIISVLNNPDFLKIVLSEISK